MTQTPPDLQQPQSLNTVGTISYILHLIVSGMVAMNKGRPIGDVA